MKSLKNLSGRAFLGLSSFSLFTTNALAQGNFDPDGYAGRLEGPGQGTLGGNITMIVNYFLGLLGLIAVVFLIYAGVLLVTAGGQEDQVSKAKKIIVYAVIGIVVVLLSYAIVTFVSSALG